MRVGIVGGNSQVAVETSLYLRELGHEVVSIVRNELGVAYLVQSGFDYRVAQYSNSNSENVFQNLDIIVIAAHARPFSRGYTSVKDARAMNTNIIKNTLTQSPQKTPIVYFSSIAAYGSKYSSNSLYIQEKRNGEDLVKSLAEKYNKRWYALRLGHVFGYNTNYYHDIKQQKTESKMFIVETSPNSSSNTVHPQLISEAIIKCGKHDVNSGTYGLVNNPQWTWDEVFKYVLPDTPVLFRDSNSGNQLINQLRSMKEDILKTGWGLFGIGGRFSRIYYHLPEELVRRVQMKKVSHGFKSGVSKIESTSSSVKYHIPIMDQPELDRDLFPKLSEFKPSEIDNIESLKIQ